jgi:inosose dehydratase
MSLSDTLKAMLPVTRFVHVKDTRINKDRAEFLLPGEGSTDYPAVLKQLQAGGYRGCVCVEVSGMIHSRKDYDPVATARRCYQNLAPAFRKAGVRLRGS